MSPEGSDLIFDHRHNADERVLRGRILMHLTPCLLMNPVTLSVFHGDSRVMVCDRREAMSAGEFPDGKVRVPGSVLTARYSPEARPIGSTMVRCLAGITQPELREDPQDCADRHASGWHSSQPASPIAAVSGSRSWRWLGLE